MIASMDPRTGRVVEELDVATDTDGTVGKAVAATEPLAAIGRAGRAVLLRSMATAFESRRDDLVKVADRETALGPVRLNNELTRTRFQLELFADVVASRNSFRFDHTWRSARC